MKIAWIIVALQSRTNGYLKKKYITDETVPENLSTGKAEKTVRMQRRLTGPLPITPQAEETKESQACG